MDKAFIQRLVWTVLAISVYVLTVFVPEVGSDLKVIAGLIVGAVWINAKDGSRPSLKPPPSGSLIALPHAHRWPSKSTAFGRALMMGATIWLTMSGCATWSNVKPVARDVNNIARELCEATMGSEAERQGLPVRELCAISYIIAPFLEAPHLASANAVLGRELERAECAP